ncbi:MAG: hypothetical protein GY862_35660 [Gammaproteobacteria bacterium]|nr:hypothetical protein [Gammaproteobacteria bacterium]
MENSIYSYQYPEWQKLKKRLYRICIVEYGGNLLDGLCPEEREAVLSAVVTAWRDKDILPYLQARQRGESEWRGWGDMMSLFYDAGSLHAEVCDPGSMKKQCIAWTRGQDEPAWRVLWTSLNRYFYEARMKLDSGFHNTQHLKNRQKIEKAIRVLEKESEEETPWRDLSDLAAGLAEYFERSGQGWPKGVKSMDSIMGYLYERSPHAGLDVTEMAALAEYLPDVDTQAAVRGCWERLDEKEREALRITRLNPPLMNGKSFKQQYGYSRETARKRAKAGMEKLGRCIFGEEENK